MSDSPQPVMQFLTPEESAEVDMAMMTARDRFSTRVAIYSLRALKQISQVAKMAIADLETGQIEDWVYQDPTLQAEQGFDNHFKNFFAQLVISSLRPLKQVAEENSTTIEDLSFQQVIQWFEHEAKRRIGGDQATSS